MLFPLLSRPTTKTLHSFFLIPRTSDNLSRNPISLKENQNPTNWCFYAVVHSWRGTNKSRNLLLLKHQAWFRTEMQREAWPWYSTCSILICSFLQQIHDHFMSKTLFSSFIEMHLILSHTYHVIVQLMGYWVWYNLFSQALLWPRSLHESIPSTVVKMSSEIKSLNVMKTNLFLWIPF